MPQTTLVIEWPRPAPPPPAFYETITRAVAQLNQSMRDFGKALLPAVERAAEALAKFGTGVRDRHNAAPHVAGICARYYVRAGLDPAYATPEALHQLVATLLDPEEMDDWDLALMSPEHRAEVAANAIAGWSSTYAVDGGPFVVHRLWGTARVEVRCG